MSEISEKEFLLRLYENSFKDESEHINLEIKTITFFTSLIDDIHYSHLTTNKIPVF